MSLNSLSSVEFRLPFLLEIARWVFDIAAAGLVVASAVFLAIHVVVVIHVWSEAMLPPAAGTAESGCRTFVFQQMVSIFHNIGVR